MQFMRAFVDDSSDPALLTLCGCWTNLSVWEGHFDPQWEDRVLRKFKLTRAHHSEYVARVKEYHGWGDAKRAEYIDAMCRVAEECDLRGFAATVDVGEVERCNARFGHSYSPYAVASALCMIGFKNSSFGNKGSAEVFFDRIDNGARELLMADEILSSDSWYKDWWKTEPVAWRHLTRPEVLTHKFKALQIADFGAWEMRVHAGRMMGTGVRWEGSDPLHKGRMSATCLGLAFPVDGFIGDSRELHSLYSRLV